MKTLINQGIAGDIKNRAVRKPLENKAFWQKIEKINFCTSQNPRENKELAITHAEHFYWAENEPLDAKFWQEMNGSLPYINSIYAEGEHSAHKQKISTLGV